MKKLIIILLIVTVFTVFAKEESLTITAGLQGFLGKYTQEQINNMITTYKTNLPGYTIPITVVVIDGTTNKDILQITSKLMNFIIELKSPIKAITQKKLPSYNDNIFSRIILPVGDAKTQIKLPDCEIGMIIANDLKSIQCQFILNGIIISNSIAGVTVKINDKEEFPAFTSLSGILSGTFKSISVKQLGNVDARAMLAPASKAGKLVVKSKFQMIKWHLFLVKNDPYQVKLAKKADKNGFWIKNIRISPRPQ